MRLNRTLLALVALASTLAAAPAATADAPSPCGARALSTPFLALGNANDYWLLQGGDFEGRAAGLGAWTAAGDGTGVSLAAGNEPWFRTGRTTDAWSARIAPPGALKSPSFCVGPRENAFRLHYWSPARAGSRLEVWATIRETRRTFRVATLGPGTGPGWRTSPPLRLFEPGAFDEAHVVLAFRPAGAAFRIDDVFVDPFRCC